MAASASGRSRLAIVGEPVVAVDLINTVAAPGSAVTNDLLSAERGAAAWWRVERARVPDGGLPDIQALRRLRSALRDVIVALVDDCPVSQGAVSDLNFFTRSAPASTRLRLTGTGLLAETHWHGEYGGNSRLAFIATQAAAFLSDPSKVSKLRRCANPACSMILHCVNPGVHGARPAYAATGYASRAITVAHTDLIGGEVGQRSGSVRLRQPRLSGRRAASGHR
jgi:predicted RNA-binding Zn ribbon-like protein